MKTILEIHYEARGWYSGSLTAAEDDFLSLTTSERNQICCDLLKAINVHGLVDVHRAIWFLKAARRLND